MINRNERSTEPIESDRPVEPGVSWKTIWIIIAVNALISTIVSLLVVLIVGPWAFGGAISGFPTSQSKAMPQLPAEGLPLDQLVVETETPAIPSPPTPTPQPSVYVVAVGDSLSGIAAEFGVSMDDIMLANNLDNEDYLQVGQTLLIPVGGLADATPTFTPIPVPTDTPIPFDPPAETENKPAADDISLTPTPTPSPIPSATAPPLDEISVEITKVLGYGQLEQEMVVIFNQGPGINLSGWKMTGAAEGDYDFPNLFLWNGGSVRIHTTTGTNTPTDLYWDQEEPIWFSGDTIELINAQKEVMSSYQIP